MIPPILHQTWKTDSIPPQFQAWTESWARHNPGWTRMFWNDRMLVDFVGEHYPDFLATFCSYKQRNPACRRRALPAAAPLRRRLRRSRLRMRRAVHADHGGEPYRALSGAAIAYRRPGDVSRASPYLFNGTMASPPGHPFWLHLLSYLPNLASAKDVLDATGPCVLTSAHGSFADKDSLVIHPSDLFAPLDSKGRPDMEKQPASPGTLSVHHWAGTWWKSQPKRTGWNALRRQVYRARYLLTRGKQLDPDEAKRRVDPAVLERPVPTGGNIAVLVPVRDAAEHIAPFLAAMQATPLPEGAHQARLLRRRQPGRKLGPAPSRRRAVARQFSRCRTSAEAARHQARPDEAHQAEAATRTAQRLGQGAQPSDRARSRRERRLGSVDRHRCLEISCRHSPDADRGKAQDRRSELRADCGRFQLRPQQLRDDRVASGTIATIARRSAGCTSRRQVSSAGCI